MQSTQETPGVYDAEAAEERAVHGKALALLQDNGFAPMVGGAYALRVHTGIWRDTKDLDLFIRKDRVHQALELLGDAGYRVELTDPMWIAKAFGGPYFVDLIFCSGNGVATVDEQWEANASRGRVLEREALIVPAEEMIWQKAYIQERERFDGADIHHLIRFGGRKLNWERLLDRFGHHWPVLFVHLVTFRFAFPSEKDQIPGWVMRELGTRQLALENERAEGERICMGTLISRQQYLHALDHEGFLDGRELEVEGWRGDIAFPRPLRLDPARRRGAAEGGGDADRGGR